MTRKQKIEAIVEQMENWDLETIIEVAKDMRRDELKRLSAKQIETLYQHEVTGNR